MGAFYKARYELNIEMTASIFASILGCDSVGAVFSINDDEGYSAVMARLADVKAQLESSHG